MFSNYVKYFIFLHSVIYAQEWVTSVLPLQNGVGLERDISIEVSFNRKLNNAMHLESTVVVSGDIYGRYYPSNIIYNKLTNTITFKPKKLFGAGEKIQVSVTPKIQDAEGHFMPSGFVWQFLVGSRSNSGVFQTTKPKEIDIWFSDNINVGDFNRDGNVDISNVDYGLNGTLNLFLGKGNGSFNDITQIPSHTVWTQFDKSIDLDSDDDLDLVVGSTSLDIYLNDGNGEFEFDTSYSIGGVTGGYISADLNGDGINDLLRNNSVDSSVTTMICDGKGRFTQNYTGVKIGFCGTSNAVADFDNNGTLDGAVSVYNGEGVGGTGVSIFSNDGTGKMTILSQIYYYPGLFYWVEAGDLDGDRDADIAVMDSGEKNTKIYLNNGSGSFTFLTKLPAKKDINDIHLQDLDGDGDIDVVASDASGTIAIWKNNGNAVFTEERVATWYAGISFKSADFDNDGDVDIVGVTYCYCGGYVEIIENISPMTIKKQLESIIPTLFALRQNYPNPFNGSTVIQYDLPNDSQVSIDIYDVMGRKVTTLFNDGQKQGTYQIKWKPEVSSGVYLCRFNAQPFESGAQRYSSMMRMQYLK